MSHAFREKKTKREGRRTEEKKEKEEETETDGDEIPRTRWE